MSTIARSTLINRINNFAKAVGIFSSWQGSQSAFGHIDGATESDYVFEFFCYVTILDNLKAKQQLKFLPGTKNGDFPKKPALKSNGWARFDIEDFSGTTLYQACAGTTIKLSDCPSTSFAPDISFQTANASDDPDENEVVLVMDAKFKSKRGGIDFALIKEFVTVVTDLQVENGSTNLQIEFDQLSDLKANCLISNGGVAATHDQYCRKKSIRQIGEFGTGNNMEIAG